MQQSRLQAEGGFSDDIKKKARRNVVVIKFTRLYPFDGETAENSEATGFVIDAKKGLVLTNRHVAGPGPFWGWCIFDDKEEALCQPLYIDPVHDFAILKYEPSTIRYTYVDGLDLSLARASAGQSLLVVGNNAGEKISDNYGNITLVERNAPEYANGYSDFNISYYQANIHLSGGISGSPALGADGSVLGIVSGGCTDGVKVSFILPSTAILKALKRLVRDQIVPRGDIRCRFLLTPLYKCQSLGLTREWEDKLHEELRNGRDLLVADTVIANGPAYNNIMPGDIILYVNETPISTFEELADILNDSVGRTVCVGLLRDSKFLLVEVEVQSLHTTPNKLVRLGEIVCHDLSFVLAVQHGVPVEGVYVAESGEPTMIGDGGPGYIIQEVNEKKVHSLDNFIYSLKSFRKGQCVTLRCAHLESLHMNFSCLVTLDVPNGVTVVSLGLSGIWEKQPFYLEPYSPSIASTQPSNLFPNIVHIESRSYIHLDGFRPRSKRGLGVVVDTERGLILVSRRLVPHKACHITITCASAEIVGRCWFIHAYHGYTIVHYDASLAPKYSVNFSKKALKKGMQARLIYFPEPERILQDDARVCSVQITEPDMHNGYSYSWCHPVNADLVGIDASSEIKTADGVITDVFGSVSAIWMSSVGGIKLLSILDTLTKLKDRLNPVLYVMPAEIEKKSFLQIRKMGMLEQDLRSLHTHPNAFVVRRTASTLLKESDIILEVDGKVCTGWESFDLIRSHTISVKILRQSREENIELRCNRLDGLETSRCIEFCGAYIQPPHLAIRDRLSQIPSEVYISHVQPGSPGELCSLPPKTFIVSVDGVAVTDFDSFENIVRESLKSGDMKITVATPSGCNKVCVLKINHEHYGLVKWEFDGSVFITKPSEN